MRELLIDLLRGFVRVEHVKTFCMGSYNPVSKRILFELGGYSSCGAKIFLYGKI